MKWNWQQEDWPNFRYESDKITHLEDKFLHSSGIMQGSFLHINSDDKKKLTIELISSEAIKTSEIEGEILNRDSVQSSIKRHFGLNTDHRKIPPAENGIAEMMINLYEEYNQNLTQETLLLWHKMLCNGRRDIANIGSYRTHTEPMQVISGPLHKPIIHFEAPESDKMQNEMDKFIIWFAESQESMRPLTRASIAHLYFVSIHPFEDGNGRIARAIAEKSLSEHLGYPTLIVLSTIIEKNKKQYYEMLEKSNKHNEITEWVIYFSTTIIEAQQKTLENIEFLIHKTKFFDSFQGQLNERQKKVILRLFDAGPDGFEGGLSAKNYRSITGTTSATATRDLKDLVDKNALKKTGELKHARYCLSVLL